MLRLQQLFLFVAMLLAVQPAVAQETWPSPEVEQMYRNALECLSRADYTDAAITLKHAISLAPRKTILYRDLANALFLSESYHEAEETLSSLGEMPDADDLCYKILAASQAAQHEIKDALSTLKKGLHRYPASGLLYYEKGLVYKEEKNQQDALLAWLGGIEQAPAYPGNYFEASQAYLGTDNVLWGLIYGEIYVNITRDTTGMQALEKLLLAGYKTMFDNIAKDVPEYGKTKQNVSAGNFIDAVQQVYTALTPVVSDGITTENLTMVRTRFLMDWCSQYAGKYPFSLFSYMDELVRTGHFDIYNEWLFGKAESEAEYNSWNTFHEGDLARFALWQKDHPLHPSAQDFYNNKDLKNLFKSHIK